MVRYYLSSLLRIRVIALCLAIILGLITLPANAEDNISVYLDNKLMSFSQSPIIENGVTLVPLRTIFESLGATVSWDNETRTVTAIKSNITINLTIGNNVAYINWQPTILQVPGRIVNGSTLVPLRFVSEALGAKVTWDGNTRTITITSNDVMPEKTVKNGNAYKLDEIPAREISLLKREFKWKYGGWSWTYTLYAPEEVYNYYTNLERPPTNNYSVYVTHPEDDEYISALVNKFREAADKHNFSGNELVDFVVSFVQSMKYVTDDVSRGFDEYPKYPLETLIDQGGDCEDTSILIASMLRELGYGVVLLALPDHMAVGVLGEGDLQGYYVNYQGKKYYYLETTADGWKVGQIPEQYKNQKATILPLIPQPVITHSWTTKLAQDSYVEVTVKVNNKGTATAKNTFVYVAFDAGNNLVYSESFSDALDLDPGYEGTYTVYIKPPYNVKTRLLVKIIVNGELWDESSSNWMEL